MTMALHPRTRAKVDAPLRVLRAVLAQEQEWLEEEGQEEEEEEQQQQHPLQEAAAEECRAGDGAAAPVEHGHTILSQEPGQPAAGSDGSAEMSERDLLASLGMAWSL